MPATFKMPFAGQEMALQATIWSRVTLGLGNLEKRPLGHERWAATQLQSLPRIFNNLQLMWCRRSRRNRRAARLAMPPVVGSARMDRPGARQSKAQVPHTVGRWCRISKLTPPLADSQRLLPVGTWLSLVEHSLGVRGVGSSNLPVPTKKSPSLSRTSRHPLPHFLKPLLGRTDLTHTKIAFGIIRRSPAGRCPPLSQSIANAADRETSQWHTAYLGLRFRSKEHT